MASNSLRNFVIIGLIFLILMFILTILAVIAGGMIMCDMYEQQKETSTQPCYYIIDDKQECAEQCVGECVEYSENNSDLWSSCPTCY